VPPDPSELNLRRWRAGDHVADYANRVLRPVEVVLLARYRDALSGRVLELGCGAGRILGYLVALGGEVHGVDISPGMVAYCRRHYPGASVHVGDMIDLPEAIVGPFDVIFAPYNVLDVFDDAPRRKLLADMCERLAPAGLLIFSSHNLAFAIAGSGRAGPAWRVALGKLDRPPSELLRMPLRLPERIRNRRRLARLARREGDHAILNDPALDYGLLHYYIRPDDQQRQLDQLGYELLECLDLDGRRVHPGDPADGCSELHYVARRR
jgi:SAM-dependent methyltransferase